MERFRDLARQAARLATGRLGWMPEQFWQATPEELRTVLEGRFGVQERPLGGGELKRLEEMLADERGS